MAERDDALDAGAGAGGELLDPLLGQPVGEIGEQIAAGDPVQPLASWGATAAAPLSPASAAASGSKQ